MSKTNDSITNDSAANAVFSCEFFPPRTDAGLEKLQATQRSLQEAINPSYYSVTFGAGGTTRDRTLETVKTLIGNKVNTVPHISCIGSSKQQISTLLEEYKNLGVTRLVALRGDMPYTGEPAKELLHADQLISFIRETTGEHFTIEVAAYPEYHPESASPQTDLNTLKIKSLLVQMEPSHNIFIMLMRITALWITAKALAFLFLSHRELCQSPTMKV